jgi:hypothetical protein
MGMAWYKFYNYFFLPFGILGYIVGLSNISIEFYPFYLKSAPYPTAIPQYIFVVIAVASMIIDFALIFGLHFKKLWAWYLNFFSLALFTVANSLHGFASIPIFICTLLLSFALWFVPNYTYFKRRKLIFIK